MLANAVLEGKTRGYRHHPQLIRFRKHPDPLAAINAYLMVVWCDSHLDPLATWLKGKCRAGVVEPTGMYRLFSAELRREEQQEALCLMSNTPTESGLGPIDDKGGPGGFAFLESEVISGHIMG